jgi:Flp pilus assembly pilin Flp
MRRPTIDERGAVMVEYVVVLVLVVTGASAVLVLLGVAMARFYAAQQAWLLLPLP